MTAADLKSRFGTAIKSQRAFLRISQEELADRAGLHRTYVSDVERGARNLSIESIEKLAHALGISVSRLFEQAGEQGGPATGLEILLVEDDPSDVELTLRAFRRARIMNTVRVVSDGVEALDFLFATGAHTERRELPMPGVILLDLHLPRVDGMQVLRRIRAEPATREIPVVVLTVSRHPDDLAECRELGVNAYIVKPVDFRNFSEVTPQLHFDWQLVRPN